MHIAGSLLLLVTLMCYALAMTMGEHMGFSAPAVLGLLAAAALGLFLFVFLETHVHQPMIDLTIFRDSLFSMNLLMSFLVFTMNGGVLILPFFLELVMGYSIVLSGLPAGTKLDDLPREAIAAAVAGTYRAAALFGLIVVILALSALKLGRRKSQAP